MPTGRKALNIVQKWPITLRSAHRLHDPSQVFESQMMTVIVSHQPKSRLQLSEKPACAIVSHSHTVSETKASYLAPDGRDEVRGPATTIVKSFTRFLTLSPENKVSARAVSPKANRSRFERKAGEEM